MSEWNGFAFAVHALSENIFSHLSQSTRVVGRVFGGVTNSIKRHLTTLCCFTRRAPSASYSVYVKIKPKFMCNIYTYILTFAKMQIFKYDFWSLSQPLPIRVSLCQFAINATNLLLHHRCWTVCVPTANEWIRLNWLELSLPACARPNAPKHDPPLGANCVGI